MRSRRGGGAGTSHPAMNTQERKCATADQDCSCIVQGFQLNRTAFMLQAE